MVIDNQIKAKTWQICRDVFGENAEAIYGNRDALSYGEPDDVTFCTNLKSDEITYVRNYHLAWGASKLVIIPPKENFVVKVDIDATYDWDADEQEYTIVREVNEDDRALREEASLYDNASKELKQVLVPVHYVFDYNRKIPVYIQEKFEQSIDDKFDSDWDAEDDVYVEKEDRDALLPNSVRNKLNSLTSTCYLKNHQYFIYEKWLKRFGYNTTMKIAEELCELSDLHNGNMAVMRDGIVKICDYAGYNHSYHWINSADEDNFYGTGSSNDNSSGRS